RSELALFELEAQDIYETIGPPGKGFQYGLLFQRCHVEMKGQKIYQFRSPKPAFLDQCPPCFLRRGTTITEQHFAQTFQGFGVAVRGLARNGTPFDFRLPVGALPYLVPDAELGDSLQHEVELPVRQLDQLFYSARTPDFENIRIRVVALLRDVVLLPLALEQDHPD